MAALPTSTSTSAVGGHRPSPGVIWRFAAFAPLPVTPSKSQQAENATKDCSRARMVHAAARAAMAAVSRQVWRLAPLMIATAMMAAATQSMVMQNGGHHRVLAT